MMVCISAACAIVQCLSVCLSIRFIYCVKIDEDTAIVATKYK